VPTIIANDLAESGKPPEADDAIKGDMNESDGGNKFI
jgi:hypothetical protein